MIQSVIDLLQAYNVYSELLLNELQNRIVEKVLSPKELVLREGEVCRYIYFITKGGLRSYILKEKKEITVWFMLEKDMAAAADSFFLQIPGKEYIEAMVETEVVCISYENFWLVCEAFPAFKTMALKLLAKYHAMFYQRTIELLVLTKQERYDYLMEKQPELAERFPLSLIKSYLGMSQASLSRIRGKDKGKRKRRGKG